MEGVFAVLENFYVREQNNQGNKQGRKSSYCIA